MKSYPLQWPSGWRRSRERKEAEFNQRVASATGCYRDKVTITGGMKRVLQQLRAFRVEEGDAIISTNLTLRLDGQPKGDQKEPLDPGVAVYWKVGQETTHKVMAVDRYDRVADNLAALAATLEAMRAIERHGGAVILERAFMGFLALPVPNTWRAVLGFDEGERIDKHLAKQAYYALCKIHHPDNRDTTKIKELNWAWAEAQKEFLGNG